MSSKLFEHIICKHIRNHLDHHGILTPLNHGFRSKHSCDTQLLLTVQYLISLKHLIQFRMTACWGSWPFKASLHGPVLNWTTAFLKNREQRVVVDGEQSKAAAVDSGVPQGTFLGPLLFLLHINDLPNVVDSQVRLFADDCLMYRPIHSLANQVLLPQDLSALERWGETWGMHFNASKCNIMGISRACNPITRFYSLCGQVLLEVDTAKYLGVNLSA